jgi:hypothetical protein
MEVYCPIGALLGDTSLAGFSPCCTLISHTHGQPRRELEELKESLLRASLSPLESAQPSHGLGP